MKRTIVLLAMLFGCDDDSPAMRDAPADTVPVDVRTSDASDFRAFLVCDCTFRGEEGQWHVQRCTDPGEINECYAGGQFVVTDPNGDAVCERWCAELGEGYEFSGVNGCFPCAR